jgi:outer membrane protein OmpA-like peptidoglycan-associated protein
MNLIRQFREEYELTLMGKIVLLASIVIIALALYFTAKAVGSLFSHLTNNNEKSNQFTQVTVPVSTEALQSPVETVNDQTTDPTLSTSETDEEEITPQITSQTGAVLNVEDERILYRAQLTLNFESNQATLSQEMKKQLDQFALTAKAFYKQKVAVVGVSIMLQDMTKSETLALDRATVVYEYLLSKGLAKNQLVFRTKILNPSGLDREALYRASATEIYFEGYARSDK